MVPQYHRPIDDRRRLPPLDDRLSQRCTRPTGRCGQGHRFARRHPELCPRRWTTLDQRADLSTARREHYPDHRERQIGPTPTQIAVASGHRSGYRNGSIHDDPSLTAGSPKNTADQHFAGDRRGLSVSSRHPSDDRPDHRRSGLAHRDLRRDVPARLQPRQPLAHGANDLDRLRRRRCDRRD